jgi:hypothetical protein
MTARRSSLLSGNDDDIDAARLSVPKSSTLRVASRDRSRVASLVITSAAGAPLAKWRQCRGRQAGPAARRDDEEYP